MPVALETGAQGPGGEPSLRWTLRCAGSRKALGSLPIRPGKAAASLIVPEPCQAQWLELEGQTSENRSTVELTIRGLHLAPEAAR